MTTRDFVRLVYDAAGNPPKLQAMPAALLAAVALFSPMLRAVREQQYQRTAPWIVDYTKFAQAFGVEVTPHREAVAVTLSWFAGTMSNGS